MASRLSRAPHRPAGLLLAILALVGQLALGAMVMPADAAAVAQSVAELDAASILCVGTPPPVHAPPHRHHAIDCALCPLCAAMATHGVILSAAPSLPAPPAAIAARAALPPPARAPPAQPRRAALPRGPPILA
jgi:hypothetical protein